jgi:hypothetical protein
MDFCPKNKWIMMKKKESFLQPAFMLHYGSFPNNLLTLLLLHTVVAPFCNHPPIYYTIFHLLPCLQSKKNQLLLSGDNNVLLEEMATFKINSSNDECNSSHDFRGLLAQQKLLTALSCCSEIFNLSFKCQRIIFYINFPSRVLMHLTIQSVLWFKQYGTTVGIVHTELHSAYRTKQWPIPENTT